jgi:integrase
MPSVQRGQVYRKPSGTWAYRHHDADGRRREVAKFRTKSEASEALRDALDDVRLGSSRRREVSFAELVDRFLAAHEADDLTLTKLAAQLRRAKTDLGERPIADLRPDELAAWRRSLPANRHHQFRAVAQVLNQAVRWEWIDKSPARHIANPKPKAPEIQPFTDWAEIVAIVEEMDSRFAAIPLFAVGTGLRPEEWIALERRDVDWNEGVVHVRRVFTHGQLKECAKSSRQRRRVPLRRRVVEALDEIPPRLDSPLLFPAARGGHIELGKFRARHWAPALSAAGVEHRRIYDCRHTYATWSLAAGVSLFNLSRRMGTSIAMIDATYGHLAPDAEEHERALLDAYDSREQAVERRAR